VVSDLIKARLTFLVLLTTLVGFYVGFSGGLNWLLLFHTMLGTALVASGAAALNQFAGARTRRQNAPNRRPATAVRAIAARDRAGFGWCLRRVWPDLSRPGGEFDHQPPRAITLGSYLFIYTPLNG